MTQDAKKDEFRKYLEKAGVLELLTKSLVSLYEEPEKPNDALSYLKNSVGGSPTDKEMIAKLREENELLKGKVKELEASQVALEARVAALSPGSVSSSAEEKEDQAPTAAAQLSSEPAAPATVETPSDASGTTAESKPAEEKSDSEASAAVEPMETEASADTPAVAAAETPNEASPAKEAQEKEGEGEAGGE